mmetsp:Transcript_32125/g.73984  ORF Transcript_32125/g.73984 Transcript_32125/m.73984 type:complete len:559 (-) Transcript_32125:55-1731(-)
MTYRVAAAGLITWLLQASAVEISGFAIRYDLPEPLNVSGLSHWLSEAWDDDPFFDIEAPRHADVSFPATWSCSEQKNLEAAGPPANVSVKLCCRRLPEIAYAMAGVYDNSLLLHHHGHVIFLEVWKERIEAQTGRGGEGHFEVESGTDVLEVGFHAVVQQLAIDSLKAKGMNFLEGNSLFDRINDWERQKAYCAAFAKGVSDFSYRHQLENNRHRLVKVSLDKATLLNRTSELRANLTAFLESISARLGLSSVEDAAIVIQKGSYLTLCLPDSATLSSIFKPQQIVVELDPPPTGRTGLDGFQFQRRIRFLGPKPAHVESFDFPAFGMVLCQVREGVALQGAIAQLTRELNQLHDEKLAGPRRESRDKSETEEAAEQEEAEAALFQALTSEDAYLGRFSACWELQKPSIQSCNSDEVAEPTSSVLKFERIYKEIISTARRSGPPARVCPTSLSAESRMVVLEADSLVKPKGRASLVQLLLEFMQKGHCQYVQVEQPASSVARFYARVVVREEDEDVVRKCIKEIAKSRDKKTNVKKVETFTRHEVNNEFGDSPRSFDI